MSDPQNERKTMSADEFDVRGRRSFLTCILGLGLAGAGISALSLQSAEGDRIPGVLRSGHDFNGAIWKTLYGPDRLAPTFDSSDARPLRVNGRHGVRDEIDLDAWTLEVVGPDGMTIGSHDIDDIKALPFEELTVEHKCVEGWSEIVTWGGTQFANLADLYPEAVQARYINMQTPDGDYYVSLDSDSMFHPQTLLAWELNGEPLTQLHGAPLRLSTPLKYGIKQIKRISRIEFSNERGPDYWTERGYDWYSGL
jgi:DMSO/TMAO reductase YedYZ molybdopterin-dependent catalytic subunit